MPKRSKPAGRRERKKTSGKGKGRRGERERTETNETKEKRKMNKECHWNYATSPGATSGKLLFPVAIRQEYITKVSALISIYRLRYTLPVASSNCTENCFGESVSLHQHQSRRRYPSAAISICLVGFVDRWVRVWKRQGEADQTRTA